jgi:hypothetical protein
MKYFLIFLKCILNLVLKRKKRIWIIKLKSNDSFDLKNGDFFSKIWFWNDSLNSNFSSTILLANN